MKAAFFEKSLRSIREANFRVREIEYCGQGEPLMNREFPEFVRLARAYFPGTSQRLITNGNFDYSKATGGEAIDEILVSCDGRRQKSYEQYRVFGNVDVALAFMRAIPKKIGRQRQLVIWKYILFEFNDSDEEILEAQKLAQELKVD
jgi:MoaA/NifB/PqqE/SkfB family radical SAM enzyme